MAQTQTAYIPLAGGLDLVSPALNIQPGYLLDCQNYIPAINGGYQRVAGYERFDGQTAPSSRRVFRLVVDNGDFVIGDILNGPDGSGSVVILEDHDGSSSLLGLCSYNGTFNEGDTVSNGTSSAKVVTALELDNSDLEDRKDWIDTVETHYRHRITKPAGDGAIEGVYEHKGTVIAFRANADHITASYSTDTGWKELTIDHYLMRYHQAGTNQPEEGTTITGHESGASATILRSVRYGGSSDDRTVSGYLLLDKSSVSEMFTDSEHLIAGEYDGGTLDTSEYLLLTAIADTELKAYPQPGDKIETESGTTAVLAEAITAEIQDDNTQQLALLLTDINGEFAKDDILLFPQPDDDGNPVDPVTVGTVNQAPETIYKLLPVDELPNPDDLLVFPTGEATLKQHLTIQQEDDTEHHYLRLDNITGTIAPGDSLQVKITVGRADGQQWPFSLTSGGRFEFVEYNFYAGNDTFRLYGCNGKDPAFEFAAGVLLPILMPEASDQNNPVSIEVHQDHLFLGFDTGMVRHSVVGEPLNFNGTLGAAEIGVGDPVTDLESIPGGVLVIASKNKLNLLYGNNTANWEKKLIARHAGARTGTVLSMGNTYLLDDAGIVDLARTEAFGDYEHATVSRLIQPLFNRMKNRSIGAAAFRYHNHIRYYFTEGDALVFKPESQTHPQITLLKYPIDLNCVCSVEDEQGEQAVWFGCKNGWVYRDGLATSFDGEPVESVLQTCYHHFGSANLRKSFKRMELDFSGQNEVDLRLQTELDYSGPHTASARTNTLRMFGSTGGYWEADDWNSFYWNGQDVSQEAISLSGTGRNLSVLIYHRCRYARPFTLQGFLAHYIPRRLDRG